MAATLGEYIPNSKMTMLLETGFIDTTSYFTQIKPTNPITVSLGPGFVVGQLKRIQLVDTDVEVILTSTYLLDAADIKFTLKGDAVELMWTRTGWRILALWNAAGSTGSPKLI